MSIKPYKDADFTPSQGAYTELTPFRYWCQKVLPLVYDDSLSYYELLCKVVDYLNKTMQDVETLHGDVDGLHEAYVKLQSYVNEYFNSLDVQEEINNKLDSFVTDGTMSKLIEPFVTQQIGGVVGSQIGNVVAEQIGDTVEGQIGGVVASQLNGVVNPIIRNTLPALVVNSIDDMHDTYRSYILKGNSHIYQYSNGWNDTGVTYGSSIGNVATSYATIVITDNLANHVSYGSISFMFTDDVKPNDLPDGFSGHNGNIENIVALGNGVLQIVTDASVNRWYRYVQTDGSVTTPWQRVLTDLKGNAYTYRGKTTAERLNLSKFMSCGSYCIDMTEVVPSDLPDGAKGNVGVLNTIYSLGAFQVQIYIDANINQWVRYASSSNAGTWHAICYKSDVENTAKYSVISGIKDNLANHVTYGSISFTFTDDVKPNDLPDEFSGHNGNIENIVALGNGVLQIVTDASVNRWYRYVQTDGSVTTPWQRVLTDNVASGKTNLKWYACGDSFTHGDWTGLSEVPKVGFGRYRNYSAVYPYFIGSRDGYNVTNFAVNGSTIAERTDGTTGWQFCDHYQEIPEDVDIITIYYGINDSARCTLGSIDDETTSTFYGSYNVILKWLLTNRPNAAIGVVATNGGKQTFVDATKEVAKKWGVPCLDMNSADHMLVISSHNTECTAEAKQLAFNKYCVTPSNGHPNAIAHSLQSGFIGEWIKSLH